MDTYDAQTAFKELRKHALKSSGDKISSGKILTYITSTKINDEQWRGTATAFIIH